MLSYGMAFTTLISTAALALHFDDPAFAIVDCRMKLDDEIWGPRQFKVGHIPGALYADLNRDLSAPKTGANGRHPLPDPAALAARLGQLGIASGVQVVAYDQDNGMFASRLWWLLRWLGHDAVAVLDGGLARWRADGRPVVGGETHRDARVFSAAPRKEMSVDAEAVAQRAGSREWRLAVGRAPAGFLGAGGTPHTHDGH